MDIVPGEHGLPAEWCDRVRSELGDREQLVWAGQPRVGRYVRQAVPVVLFGIPFTAFAAFWTASAWVMLFGFGGDSAGPGLPFNLLPYFGVPFVLVGLALLSSPAWYWWWAKGTCYALTRKRAIIWQAGLFGGVTVRSYGPDALTKAVRTENADGSGDLVFEQVVHEGADSDGHRTTRTVRYGFMAVANVRHVAVLVQGTLPTSER